MHDKTLMMAMPSVYLSPFTVKGTSECIDSIRQIFVLQWSESMIRHPLCMRQLSCS